MTIRELAAEYVRTDGHPDPSGAKVSLLARFEYQFGLFAVWDEHMTVWQPMLEGAIPGPQNRVTFDATSADKCLRVIAQADAELIELPENVKTEAELYEVYRKRGK